MAMIQISITRTNYKPETIDIKSNIDLHDSHTKVKLPVKEIKQKQPSIEPDRTSTSAERTIFYVKILGDVDDTSKDVSSPRNRDNCRNGDMHENYKRCYCHSKVRHCSGNVCPRCHKCIGWSCNDDIPADDYKRHYRSDKKATHCDGNACSRCGKCIDWSYDGNMHDDYERYRRDNKNDKILDRNLWRRHPNATCSFYSVHSHFYQYYPSYHSHYCGYPNCNVCEC